MAWFGSGITGSGAAAGRAIRPLARLLAAARWAEGPQFSTARRLKLLLLAAFEPKICPRSCRQEIDVNKPERKVISFEKIEVF